MSKTANPLPSVSTLRRIFKYDPVSGDLSKIDGSAKRNSRSRYVIAYFDGQFFLAHRVIWKMMTGNDPNLVDHIDGDGRNNKWENLRECDDAQNLWNRSAPRHNSSGIKGVSFDKANKKWRASITCRGKVKNLGRFSTIEEATEVRHEAEMRLHGAFARAA